MAKEQRHGNRETKKPKKQKDKVASSAAATTFKDIPASALAGKKTGRK
ncbi:MAG: hypothetical protein ACFCUR_10015 [Rhodomicrobiaceae bacterium]